MMTLILSLCFILYVVFLPSGIFNKKA